MAAQSIPDGFHTLTPYLIVDDASRAIEFYQQAYGATELMRLAGPGGKIAHAELRIGDSIFMLADEYPEMDARAPHTIGGSPVTLHLYVDDVDAWFERAVSAGAIAKRPLKDQFYGDRTACVEDPFGHKWYLATHVEDVSPQEMQRRFAEIVQQVSEQSVS